MDMEMILYSVLVTPVFGSIEIKMFFSVDLLSCAQLGHEVGFPIRD